MRRQLIFKYLTFVYLVDLVGSINERLLLRTS
jgi:hypothetical protein